ncbi:MAG: ATP-binding protein [Kiritimatiellaeota bacterium]|nr:ATP-binding protein [Kiritimatiellota bacterium]
MGYIKEEKTGFLLRKAVEFARNTIQNYDKNISDDDFFDIFKRIKNESELAADVQSCLPAETAEQYLRRQNSGEKISATHFAELAENMDVSDILEHFYNKGATKEAVKKMLINVADAFLEKSSGETANPEQERFEALAKLLRLSPLEADAVMLASLFSWGFLEKNFDGYRRVKEFNIFIERFAVMLNARPGDIRDIMAEDGKLRRYRCLDVEFDVSDNITDYLEGIGKTPLASRFYTVCDVEPLPWPYFGALAEKHGAILKDMLASRVPGQGMHILLYGHPGTGKSSFAVALAKELGFTCNKIVQNVKSEKTEKNDSSKDLRFAALQICAEQLDPKDNLIIIDEADDMLRGRKSLFPLFGGSNDEAEDAGAGDKGMLNTMLDTIKTPCVWISNNAARDLDASTRRRFDYSVCFEKLTAGQRRQIWQNAAGRFDLADKLTAAHIERFARRYEVSAGGISIVLKNVKNLLANDATPEDAAALVERLIQPHCELLDVKPQDDRLAVAGDYALEGVNWKGEIPLPRIVDAARRFMSEASKAGGASCSTPRMDAPRMNLLLSGPPGTGKTEFVKHLGGVLETKVVLKMGSDLLDMYVGGTEQKIRRAFAQAEAENAILFMDEIDGMLQSRERAQRSWEVTQVNELLFQMENFKGVFIGATNFADHLDPAVLRRFTFKIKLDYLDDAGKVLFFERMFGATLTDAEKLRLTRIPDLAPGDFRTVRQGFYYLGGAATNHDYLDALARESDAKRQGNTLKIGF